MEIQIRLARQCDMQSVLEMSKGIYEGHDYFLHVFLRWLDDSKRRILVAEKGNVIIGLRAFHVVDDGRTVVSQSLRVHPKYRGQGVSALLIRAAQEYVQACFPSVRTERYTTMSSNVPRLAIQRKNGLDSLVLELGLVAFYIDTAVSAGSGSENGPSCSFLKKTRVDDVVRPLSFDEFRDLLEGRKLDSVVWKNTLIVDWEPFEAHPSNFLNGLIMDGDFLLASANMGSSSPGVGSLSHGRISPRVKCRHWVATIYSTDEKLLKMHVAKQLECAILQQGTTKEAFIFSCFLPKSLISCAKDYLSDEFSLEYVDFFNFNLLLFEKDFTS